MLLIILRFSASNVLKNVLDKVVSIGCVLSVCTFALFYSHIPTTTMTSKNATQ